MYYNKEIETLPLGKLRKLQSDRLKALIKRVYAQIPFYKQWLDTNNIRPDDIKGVEDISKLPFTHKEDMRNHYPYGMFAVPDSQVNRIHASSGTTGKPTVVGYTAHDLEIFDEVVARSLYCAGARKGMKLHNAYGYGLFTGGLGMHGGAQKMGMCVIPVSGGMTDRQLMIIQDFKPEVICCTPSYAQTLAEQLIIRKIPLSDINLKYAILGAEPWTETIRSQVEKGLEVKTTNIYGLSEIIGPGVSQEDVDEQGTGSYIWEDHFFPEVVDKDTGEPLPYGQEGVLVFTTLTKEASPLIRYWTNDICSIYYEASVKRTHIKMSPIKGRADDMLIIRGVNLFHTQIEILIADFPELTPNYQLIVSREGTLDMIALDVEMNKNFYDSLSELSEMSKKEKITSLCMGLRHRIKGNVGLNIPVSIKGCAEIPRSEGGKLSRIVDRRNLD